MRVVNRVVMAVAALLLGLGLVRPLWHIGLIAPQYPEGIGLYLWAGQITGQKPNDLQSINGLNHYIGMKPIVPESIPELRFMPEVLGGMMVLGLLAAVAGRRRGLFLWAGLLVVFALAALADFWRWGYQYGHELDPTAAIKIPGLSYQPPLIGSKQLLNFFATSWPALGGWAIMVSVFLGVGLSILEWRRSRVKDARELRLAA
jgi:hypothetical protein